MLESSTMRIKSITDFAKDFWESFLKPEDHVIDATAGNGKDTLFLAQKVFPGTVYAYDIQKDAIESTQKLLRENDVKNVILKEKSHEEFDEDAVKLIVYNLGYLPRGDKSITTKVSSTMKSIEHALEISEAISIMCYPGHEEGAKEEAALRIFLEELDPKKWSVLYHNWLNRKKAPTWTFLKAHSSP